MPLCPKKVAQRQQSDQWQNKRFDGDSLRRLFWKSKLSVTTVIPNLLAHNKAFCAVVIRNACYGRVLTTSSEARFNSQHRHNRETDIIKQQEADQPFQPQTQRHRWVTLHNNKEIFRPTCQRAIKGFPGNMELKGCSGFEKVRIVQWKRHETYGHLFLEPEMGQIISNIKASIRSDNSDFTTNSYCSWVPQECDTMETTQLFCHPMTWDHMYNTFQHVTTTKPC